MILAWVQKGKGDVARSGYLHFEENFENCKENQKGNQTDYAGSYKAGLGIIATMRKFSINPCSRANSEEQGSEASGHALPLSNFNFSAIAASAV